MTESLERRIRHDSTEDDLAGGDHPLESGGAPAEDAVGTAQEAEDLEQDPEAVPNRIAQAEPPTPESVEPSDPPRDYDPLYDETRRD